MRYTFGHDRRGRSGFTLIELLTVVVIIGILATIAVSRFTGTREQAYVSSMKLDLKNLGAHQEAYFSDHHTYAADAAALGWRNSEGVSIEVMEADPRGWSAHVSHSGTAMECAAFYGDAAAVSPATSAGVATCG